MRRIALLAAPALFLLAGPASAQSCQAMLNALADAGATRGMTASAAPQAAATAEPAQDDAGGESGTEATAIPEGVATSVMPGADASAENDVEEPDAAAEAAPAASPAEEAEEAVEAVSPAATEDAGARATLLQAEAQTALDAGDNETCLSKAQEASALLGQ